MAIAYVGEAHTLNAATATSTVVINRPAGVANGHYLVAVVSWITNTVSISAVPSGWTLLASQNNGNLMTSVYTKVAASEPSSWTWTLSTNARNWGAVLAYSGVSTSTPVADYGSNTGTGTLLVTPAVDVPTGGWLVTLAAGRWLTDTSPVATTWTISGADAERVEVSGNSASLNQPTGAVYDSNGPAPGTNVTRTVTASQSMSQLVGWSIALAAEGVVTPPSGRVYQASLTAPQGTTAPPPSGRVYQASLTAPAGGTGTGRVYAAWLTAPLPVAFVPSGLLTYRSGALRPVATRVYRDGTL